MFIDDNRIALFIDIGLIKQMNIPNSILNYSIESKAFDFIQKSDQPKRLKFILSDIRMLL